ncbi:UNVERIFIED_CONTAM: hypothetical protein Sangu_0831300 [Sesamum angustifolium]|uniref:Uncharacterized protein n=1 Tax=Sesamum angustifolium TaxID=2727405 RepID=A0AAW2PWG6_9LAMI
MNARIANRACVKKGTLLANLVMGTDSSRPSFATSSVGYCVTQSQENEPVEPTSNLAPKFKTPSTDPIAIEVASEDTGLGTKSQSSR